MAVATLQLRFVQGDADVLILRKSICARSPVQGEERPARCPTKLLELLVSAMGLHPDSPRLGECPG